MILYSLTDITKTFGDRTVLDISKLEIEKGKIYSLLGPNGAGKTTLLNILGFLDLPSSGSVMFNEKKVLLSEHHLSRLRKQVVMIAQNPIMFSTTVYKNIEFGLKVRKISSNKRREIIEESLDMVGMTHMTYERANHLSGGETQRVSFARAIALSPEVILCDEPTANVDLENQAAIINILSDINAQKQITLIFTSHDRVQASNLAHHAIFLEHGMLAEKSHENFFTGEIVEATPDFSVCMIQRKITLKTPPAASGKIRMRIDPRLIEPIIDDNHTPSSNIVSGRIVQIVLENQHIRMIIHAGVDITCLIPKDAYLNRQKHFIVGSTLKLSIPQNSISILAKSLFQYY